MEFDPLLDFVGQTPTLKKPKVLQKKQAFADLLSDLNHITFDSIFPTCHRIR